MRRNIAYKVVFKKDDKFLSSNAYYEKDYSKMAPSFKLEYGVGKTTVPTFGKIFIFKDLKSAKIWAGDRPHSTYIIKGYVTNPTQASSRLYVDDLLQGNNFEDFWKGNPLSFLVSKARVPASTMFCDNFTGIEVVKK